jgi:sensor domain CHASE-containing protein
MDDQRLLQPLVRLFGQRLVWEEGQRFFGYPVTWDLDVAQVVSFRKHLEGLKR